MGAAISYRTFDAPIAEAAAPLLDLCNRAFDGFEPDYLLDRLPRLADPVLLLALDGSQWVGFKLAYRRGTTMLYSWLGGVDPAFRRHGIASALMTRQHQAAAMAGYRTVETRTRATNNGMLILNLRHGFQVCGFEVDAGGLPIILQRKAL